MQTANNYANDDAIEIDLQELFFFLLHRLWILLLFALIGGGSTVVSHIKAAKVAAAAPRTVEGEYAVVQDAAAENAESDTANTDNEHQSES